MLRCGWQVHWSTCGALIRSHRGQSQPFCGAALSVAGSIPRVLSAIGRVPPYIFPVTLVVLSYILTDPQPIFPERLEQDCGGTHFATGIHGDVVPPLKRCAVVGV